MHDFCHDAFISSIELIVCKRKSHHGLAKQGVFFPRVTHHDDDFALFPPTNSSTTTRGRLAPWAMGMSGTATRRPWSSSSGPSALSWCGLRKRTAAYIHPAIPPAHY